MKRTILALILVFAMVLLPSTVLAKDSGGRFSDISESWAKDSIDRRTRGDIFDSTGKFQPNKQITRMEFVLLLHSAMDININYLVAPDISDTYSDVKNTDKGASQLIDLVTAGIIDRKTTFGPNEKLTREELLHYIINALNYATDGSYPLIKMMPAPFKDDDKIDPAYKNDIIIAQLLNIVKGDGTMLYPKHCATRAEAVTFIDRMLSFVESLNPVMAEVDISVRAQLENDGLTVSIILTNNSDKTVEIGHGAGQLFDYSIYDAKGNVLYTWTEGKAFIMMYVYTTVKPGESVSFSETLDKETYAKIKDKMYYVKGFVNGTTEDFDISSEGYKTSIEKASGLSVSVEARIVNGGLVMEMVLDNSSKTDVVINHTSSQSFDFKIFDDKGVILYTWSADKMFMQALTTTTVQAGESVSYTDRLDKAAFAAIKCGMSYLKGYITGTSESFTVDKDGYAGK